MVLLQNGRFRPLLITALNNLRLVSQEGSWLDFGSHAIGFINLHVRALHDVFKLLLALEIVRAKA